MKPSRKIPPTHASPRRLPSYPEKAAEEPVSPTGSVIHLSRSETTTAGVVFTCICGVDVHGIIQFVNGYPTQIKCGNCGSLHKACKHQVRMYDCENHEFTCQECLQVTPGTLKIRASGTNLPDGSPISVGGQVGSRPPIPTEHIDVSLEKFDFVIRNARRTEEQ